MYLFYLFVSSINWASRMVQLYSAIKTRWGSPIGSRPIKFKINPF